MRNCVAGRVLGVLAWSPHHDASRGLIRLAFNIGPLSFSGKTGFHVLTPAQVFGLHENCEITCAESLARRESCSRVAALIEMGCLRVSDVMYKGILTPKGIGLWTIPLTVSLFQVYFVLLAGQQLRSQHTQLLPGDFSDMPCMFGGSSLHQGGLNGVQQASFAL